MADVAFGLDLLRVSPTFAMNRLFRWSSIRLALFVTATFAALLLGEEASAAVLTGAILQFVVMLPWRVAARLMFTRDRLRAATELAQRAAHLSVASTACGILVTTPRLLARHVVAPGDLGYVGVAFIASTLIGMCFQVAWLRLANSSRVGSPAKALVAYAAEGTALGFVLYGGLWLSRPWAARAYHIAGPRFGRVLMAYGGAYILFNFVMATANLLKLSKTRLSEARAYAVSAVALAAATMMTRSLLSGLFLATAVLAIVVSISIVPILNGKTA
jgi:hypothetical protein